MGVNVNLDYLFEQVMETFEGMDKKKVFAPPALPQMGMPQMPGMEQPQPQPQVQVP
jgi:hypothetical protein